MIRTHVLFYRRLLIRLLFGIFMMVGFYSEFAHGATTTRTSRTEREVELRPEIERQRRAVEEQERRSLNADAIDVIHNTESAISALADKDEDDALAALERATGKLNILLARNPADTLLPVEAEGQLIDLAPMDLKSIRHIIRASQRAIDNKDYPTARVLFDMLRSEINVRTYHLPLAVYPATLTEVARLIGQRKTLEASGMLLAALHSLVIIDKVIPIPLLTAELLRASAEAERESAPDSAIARLGTIRTELERSRELGYMANDATYTTLRKSIDDIERMIRNKENSAPAFAALRQRFADFTREHFETEKRLAAEQR